MRFIPVSNVLAEKLKQQAKKLKRSKAVRQSEALDRVAKVHGFNHWGHVMWCLRQSEARRAEGDIIKADLIDPAKLRFAEEADYIVTCAQQGKCTLVRLKSCILFSSEDGDAWLFDADDGRAVCLCWRGVRQAAKIIEDAQTFFVEYDTQISIANGVFRVASENPLIGTRAIMGYPLEGIMEMIDSTRAAHMR